MDKTILGKLLLLLALFTLFSCSSDSSDPSEEQDADVEHNSLLVGEWAASKASDNHALADKLELYADGTGKYSSTDRNGTLKWSTSGLKLRMEFDNKVVSESNFSIDGATLTTEDGQSYVLNLPLLGQWYISSSDGTYTGDAFAYSFYNLGSGTCTYFNSAGLSVNEAFSWERLENGSIKLRLKGGDKEISFTATDNTLIIPTLGEFTKKNNFDLPGDWYSVYSEAGSIEKGEARYSTFDFRDSSAWDQIGSCTYMQDGREWVLNFAWKQMNDSYIHIYSTADDLDVLLDYRYRYNKTTKRIFMEISRENDFGQYTGYTKVKAE